MNSLKQWSPTFGSAGGGEGNWAAGVVGWRIRSPYANGGLAHTCTQPMLEQQAHMRVPAGPPLTQVELHMHALRTPPHMAQFRRGHGPVVGRDQRVGDPCP